MLSEFGELNQQLNSVSKRRLYGNCKKICPYNAIIEGKEIKMRVRKIDAENTRKLKELEDVIVLKHPYEIL